MWTTCSKCGKRHSEGGSGHGICSACAGRADDGEPVCTAVEEENQLIADLREALGYTPLPGSARNEAFASDWQTKQPGLAGSPRFVAEYQIIDEIGRGGMGVVYRARQPSLGREVALKIVHAPLAAGGARLSRFRTETRAIARLNHPNIVPIYAQGECDSDFYYVMALIDGCSLDAAIHRCPDVLSSSALGRSTFDAKSKGYHSDGGLDKRQENVDEPSEGTPPPPRTSEDFRHLAGLMADVADGLAHAHDHGVIHRDIKPQNLLLSVDGRIYVSDFGLSRLLDEPRLTLTGDMMGTPAYLSPEQVRGNDEEIDHRTDIYSLGVTLYELLTGRRPFMAKSRDQVIHRICAERPVGPRRIDRRIPRDLETICLRAISKEPRKRFSTAREMAEDLRAFAAGRPIASRRPGAASRAWMGIRRHRGLAGIGVLTCLCIALGLGYAVNVFAEKRTEADRLLREAYDQIVYFDYRMPDLVADKVAEAEALGADGGQLNLVQSLMHLGRGQNSEGVSRLRAASLSLPDNVTAGYLLAWGLWRTGAVTESREEFQKAEAMGGPKTADGWFLRGLAAHFDRPKIAIESYKQANALRAAERQFFPQAVLHLARAYNQQMYSSRSLEPFADAQAILIQLIQQGHYDAYPYYLLSITQRLSGEILEDYGDSQNPLITDRYRAALDWARMGQVLRPEDDRPITAEAECLERLGLYEEALEARTRAIAVARPQSQNQCEGYHYRWRLHFWLGNYDEALSDIRAHRACAPQSLPYAHVYSSWVAGESGDLEGALAEARAIAQEAPDDAKAVLWSAACLRVLGRAAEAQELLDARRDTVRMNVNLVPPQSEKWMAELYDLARGRKSLQDLLATANTIEDSHKLRAEAYFHAAVKDLGEGNAEVALERLDDAVHSHDSQTRYTFHAKALLVRLQRELQ